MDKNDIDYTNNRYSLTDYAISRQVCEDLPKIISIYNKLIPVLSHYQHYTGVAHVLELVHDSKTLLEIQHRYHKNIYKAKGLVKDE